MTIAVDLGRKATKRTDKACGNEFKRSEYLWYNVYTVESYLYEAIYILNTKVYLPVITLCMQAENLSANSLLQTV